MGVRDPLLAQCQKRAQRAEHRISVIGSAATIKLVALKTREPGPIPFGPADHLRLLVEMAVEQNPVLALARHVDDDDRSAPGQSDDLEGGTWKRRQLRPRPALK